MLKSVSVARPAFVTPLPRLQIRAGRGKERPHPGTEQARQAPGFAGVPPFWSRIKEFFSDGRRR